MAFGTDHIIVADVDGSQKSDSPFIPELWSDEVIAAYKSNLVMGNLVNKVNHKGKRGDTIHFPNPTRGAANAKTAETIVTFNNPAVSVIDVSINKHYEYSYLIEDITAVQALPSLRKFYTDDAGYALAKQIDQDIFITSATANGSTQYSTAVIGSDGSTAWDGTANVNTGNAAALTDAGIRQIIQSLDDNDVPLSNRALVIPPVEKNNLLGLSRFTEQAFVGEGGMGGIRNGRIGDVYGIPVYVSTNCAYVHLDTADGDDFFNFSSAAIGTGALTDSTGTAVTVTTDGGVAGRVALMFHKDWMVFAEQQGVRSQTQYKQEYLADLFTSDTIYGVGEIRDEGCIPVIVSN